MTRIMALLATAALALAVLFRSPPDYRMMLCIVVFLAALTLAGRSLVSAKPLWAIPFLGVLGLFAPFQVTRFSHQLVSVVDMASLLLFAVSPMILRRSAVTVASRTGL